jgi:hypothetical protein
MKGSVGKKSGSRLHFPRPRFGMRGVPNYHSESPHDLPALFR